VGKLETVLRKWKNKIKGNYVQVLFSAWREMEREREREREGTRIRLCGLVMWKDVGCSHKWLVS
jgi:hypothetical protein